MNFMETVIINQGSREAGNKNKTDNRFKIETREVSITVIYNTFL